MTTAANKKTPKAPKPIQYEPNVQPSEPRESAYDRAAKFDGLDPESFSHRAFYSAMWE